MTHLTIKVQNFGPNNFNFACKSQIFQISFQKMLRSLGLGLGLETFAKLLRVSVSVSKNLVSEKKSRFWFWRKVSLSVLEKLVSEEKYRFRKNLVLEKKSHFRFQSIWSRKKSLGFGFGIFGLGKKSRYRFRSKFWYRHSVNRTQVNHS